MKKELETILVDTKEYLETRIELGKLIALEKSSRIAASTVTIYILLIPFVFMLLFISIAASNFISAYYHSTNAGPVTVSIFYLVIGLILVLFRKPLITLPVINSLIRSYFK